MATLARRLLTARSFVSPPSSRLAIRSTSASAAVIVPTTTALLYQQTQQQQHSSASALWLAAGVGLLGLAAQEHDRRAQCCGIAGVVSSAKAGHDARYEKDVMVHL